MNCNTNFARLACAAAFLFAAPAVAADDSARDASGAKFEQDREAILAMAGNYIVTFDFRETVPLQAGYEVTEPYTPEASEIVRVIEDRGDFISLQHILVVYDDGTPQPLKHWRQDWTYEPAEIWEYTAEGVWEVREVAAEEAAGAWSQEVWQVDDSPRYAAVASWTHERGISEWESPVTWRPLPRREHTKRDDYEVLASINRHTITPWGWSHEQDSEKLQLTNEGVKPLVREFGVNNYIRDDAFDWDVAEAFWARTEEAWVSLADAWDRIFAEKGEVVIDLRANEDPLRGALWGMALGAEPGEAPAPEAYIEVIEPFLGKEEAALEAETGSDRG